MSSIVRRQEVSARFSLLLVSSFHQNSMRLLLRIAFFNVDVILRASLSLRTRTLSYVNVPFSSHSDLHPTISHTADVKITESCIRLFANSSVLGRRIFYFWILAFESSRLIPRYSCFGVSSFFCLQHYTPIEYAVCLRTALGFVQICLRV